METAWNAITSQPPLHSNTTSANHHNATVQTASIVQTAPRESSEQQQALQSKNFGTGSSAAAARAALDAALMGGAGSTPPASAPTTAVSTQEPWAVAATGTGMHAQGLPVQLPQQAQLAGSSMTQAFMPNAAALMQQQQQAQQQQQQRLVVQQQQANPQLMHMAGYQQTAANPVQAPVANPYMAHQAQLQQLQQHQAQMQSIMGMQGGAFTQGMTSGMMGGGSTVHMAQQPNMRLTNPGAGLQQQVGTGMAYPAPYGGGLQIARPGNLQQPMQAGHSQQPSLPSQASLGSAQQSGLTQQTQHQTINTAQSQQQPGAQQQVQAKHVVTTEAAGTAQQGAGNAASAEVAAAGQLPSVFSQGPQPSTGMETAIAATGGAANTAAPHTDQQLLDHYQQQQHRISETNRRADSSSHVHGANPAGAVKRASLDMNTPEAIRAQQQAALLAAQQQFQHTPQQQAQAQAAAVAQQQMSQQSMTPQQMQQMQLLQQQQQVQALQQQQNVQALHAQQAQQVQALQQQQQQMQVLALQQQQQQVQALQAQMQQQMQLQMQQQQQQQQQQMQLQMQQQAARQQQQQQQQMAQMNRNLAPPVSSRLTSSSSQQQQNVPLSKQVFGAQAKGVAEAKPVGGPPETDARLLAERLRHLQHVVLSITEQPIKVGTLPVPTEILLALQAHVAASGHQVSVTGVVEAIVQGLRAGTVDIMSLASELAAAAAAALTASSAAHQAAAAAAAAAAATHEHQMHGGMQQINKAHKRKRPKNAHFQLKFTSTQIEYDFDQQRLTPAVAPTSPRGDLNDRAGDAQPHAPTHHGKHGRHRERAGTSDHEVRPGRQRRNAPSQYSADDPAQLLADVDNLLRDPAAFLYEDLPPGLSGKGLKRCPVPQVFMPAHSAAVAWDLATALQGMMSSEGCNPVLKPPPVSDMDDDAHAAAGYPYGGGPTSCMLFPELASPTAADVHGHFTFGASGDEAVDYNNQFNATELLDMYGELNIDVSELPPDDMGATVSATEGALPHPPASTGAKASAHGHGPGHSTHSTGSGHKHASANVVVAIASVAPEAPAFMSPADHAATQHTKQEPDVGEGEGAASGRGARRKGRGTRKFDDDSYVYENAFDEEEKPKSTRVRYTIPKPDPDQDNHAADQKDAPDQDAPGFGSAPYSGGETFVIPQAAKRTRNKRKIVVSEEAMAIAASVMAPPASTARAAHPPTTASLMPPPEALHIPPRMSAFDVPLHMTVSENLLAAEPTTVGSARSGPTSRFGAAASQYTDPPPAVQPPVGSGRQQPSQQQQHGHASVPASTKLPSTKQTAMEIAMEAAAAASSATAAKLPPPVPKRKRRSKAETQPSEASAAMGPDTSRHTTTAAPAPPPPHIAPPPPSSSSQQRGSSPSPSPAPPPQIIAPPPPPPGPTPTHQPSSAAAERKNKSIVAESSPIPNQQPSALFFDQPSAADGPLAVEDDTQSPAPEGTQEPGDADADVPKSASGRLQRNRKRPAALADAVEDLEFVLDKKPRNKEGKEVKPRKPREKKETPVVNGDGSQPPAGPEAASDPANGAAPSGAAATATGTADAAADATAGASGAVEDGKKLKVKRKRKKRAGKEGTVDGAAGTGDGAEGGEDAGKDGEAGGEGSKGRKVRKKKKGKAMRRNKRAATAEPGEPGAEGADTSKLKRRKKREKSVDDPEDENQWQRQFVVLPGLIQKYEPGASLRLLAPPGVPEPPASRQSRAARAAKYDKNDVHANDEDNKPKVVPNTKHIYDASCSSVVFVPAGEVDEKEELRIQEPHPVINTAMEELVQDDPLASMVSWLQDMACQLKETDEWDTALFDTCSAKYIPSLFRARRLEQRGQLQANDPVAAPDNMPGPRPPSPEERRAQRAAAEAAGRDGHYSHKRAGGMHQRPMHRLLVGVRYQAELPRPPPRNVPPPAQRPMDEASAAMLGVPVISPAAWDQWDTKHAKARATSVYKGTGGMFNYVPPDPATLRRRRQPAPAPKPAEGDDSKKRRSRKQMYPPHQDLCSQVQRALDASTSLQDRHKIMDDCVKSMDEGLDDLLPILGMVKIGSKARVSWPAEDEAAFAAGIKDYDRQFDALQKHHLPHRTVADIVSYYYNIWKIRYTPDSVAWHQDRKELKALAAAEGYLFDEEDQED